MPTYIFPGTVNADVSDRAGRLLGIIGSFIISAFVSSLAGNVIVTNSAGVVIRIKSVVITTNATVANRSLLESGSNVASKVVAASQTNADLMDRDITSAIAGTASILNGQAGDTVVYTYERTL